MVWSSRIVHTDKHTYRTKAKLHVGTMDAFFSKSNQFLTAWRLSFYLVLSLSYSREQLAFFYKRVLLGKYRAAFSVLRFICFENTEIFNSCCWYILTHTKATWLIPWIFIKTVPTNQPTYFKIKSEKGLWAKKSDKFILTSWTLFFFKRWEINLASWKTISV